MGLDKLNLRIPSVIPLAPALGKRIREDQRAGKSPFVATLHYDGRADLRVYEIPAILQMSCHHGEAPARVGKKKLYELPHAGSHKLELLETGDKSYSKLAQVIEEVFDCDPEKLPVLRLDCCADVEGVPVNWFLEHARLRWKRHVADFSSLEQAKQLRIGKSDIETVYFGKRPNMLRVYNKVEEQYSAYMREMRKHTAPRAKEIDASDLMPGEVTERFLAERADGFERIGGPDYLYRSRDEWPPFPDWSGHVRSDVLTRVERQINGAWIPNAAGTRQSGAIPEMLSNFGKLRSRLVEFDPFEKLELSRGAGLAGQKCIGGNRSYPERGEWTLNDWALGVAYNHQVRELGEHRARKWFEEHSGHNGARIAKKFAVFAEDAVGISRARLVQLYRQEVDRQMAA